VGAGHALSPQLAATQAALKAMEAKWADDIHTVKHQMWELKKVGSAAASVSYPGALSARTELSEGASQLSARSAKSVAQQEAMMEVMQGEVVILKKEMERVQKQVAKEGPAKLGVGMPAEQLDDGQSASLAARVATVEATVAQVRSQSSVRALLIVSSSVAVGSDESFLNSLFEPLPGGTSPSLMGCGWNVDARPRLALRCRRGGAQRRNDSQQAVAHNG
jgi:hypothetical protein